MSNNKLDNNTEMEIPVFETPPGPGSSAIKVEPKEENCEDLLSAFLLDPPSVKIENEVKGEDLDEFGTLSEDYTVNIEQLKAEQSEDSKEWLNKHPLKSEEKDQLPVGEDQDDDFVENPSIIKSEEMDIKEDESINEPGISANSCDQEASAASTIFPCSKCDYKALRKSHLTIHLLRHRNPEDVNKYKCDQCKYVTMHKNHIKRHLQVHERKKGVRNTEPLSFQCDKCDYQTKNERYLAAHSVIHQNPDDLIKCGCSECDSTIRNKHLKRNQHKEKILLKCYHCSYETVRRNNFKEHLVRHRKKPENMKTFRCYKCEFRTPWMHELKDHLRVDCINIEDHDSQNAEHKQTSAINRAESDDNCKFKCQNCDYETNRKSSFTIHLKQHENPEKNTMFYCNKCDFKTISKSNRTAHYGAHKISGDLKHRCNKCEYTTDLIKDLRCHSLAHTLFEGSKRGVIKRRLQQRSSEETDKTKSSEKGPSEDSR